jgi:hypothetical protein
LTGWATSISSGLGAFSLSILSRAGRLASGWSLGPVGEEGSSSGRLAEEAAMVGDADMISVYELWVLNLETDMHALHSRRALKRDVETCSIDLD